MKVIKGLTIARLYIYTIVIGLMAGLFFTWANMYNSSKFKKIDTSIYMPAIDYMKRTGAKK